MNPHDEDPDILHLMRLEELSQPLPEGGAWSESESLKKHVESLLFAGFSDVGEDETVRLREIVDGYEYNGFICSLGFSGRDEYEYDAYGRGECVADAVLAALVQIEVDRMLSTVQ